jgi:hypothetical protein
MIDGHARRRSAALPSAARDVSPTLARTATPKAMTPFAAARDHQNKKEKADSVKSPPFI